MIISTRCWSECAVHRRLNPVVPTVCTFGRIGLAGELGFEPRLTESGAAVLPLNYSPFPSRNQHISRDREICLAVAKWCRSAHSRRRQARAPFRPSRPIFQVSLLVPRLGFAASLFLCLFGAGLGERRLARRGLQAVVDRRGGRLRQGLSVLRRAVGHRTPPVSRRVGATPFPVLRRG